MAYYVHHLLIYQQITAKILLPEEMSLTIDVTAVPPQVPGFAVLPPDKMKAADGFPRLRPVLWFNAYYPVYFAPKLNFTCMESFFPSLYFSAGSGPQELEPIPLCLSSMQSTVYPLFSSSKLCIFSVSSSWV